MKEQPQLLLKCKNRLQKQQKARCTNDFTRTGSCHCILPAGNTDFQNIRNYWREHRKIKSHIIIHTLHNKHHVSKLLRTTVMHVKNLSIYVLLISLKGKSTQPQPYFAINVLMLLMSNK